MTTAADLLGVWELIDWRRIDADGAVSFPMGEGATGRLIYAPEGTMSAIVMHPGWVQGTAPADAFLSYSAHYSLDGDVVNHRVDFAFGANMVGETLRRRVLLKDGVLFLTTLSAAGRADTESRHELRWRRPTKKQPAK